MVRQHHAEPGKAGGPIRKLKNEQMVDLCGIK